MSLLDLLTSSDNTKKVPGVVIGIVSAVDEKTARVKLKFPVLNEEDDSDWARIAVMMAGDQAGAYYLPEVGDEALCAFEHGDIRFPYVLGFLWGKDKPPASKQPQRLIKSRSGHQILLDDTEDKTSITITSKSGITIKLDDAAESLTVETKGGLALKLEDQPGTLTVETPSGTNIQLEDKPGNISLTTPGGTTVQLQDKPATVAVSTPMGVTIKATDAPPGVTIDASAAGKVAINCLMADVTAPAGITFNTPKATFAGILTAMLVQTQVLQSQAVISPSYTPGVGNIL